MSDIGLDEAAMAVLRGHAKIAPMPKIKGLHFAATTSLLNYLELIARETLWSDWQVTDKGKSALEAKGAKL